MRRLEAALTLEYDDEKTARAVADAVSPDNYKTPEGLTVKTERNGNLVSTEIKLEGKLPTLIATIDDLLSCVSTAEKALGVLRR